MGDWKGNVLLYKNSEVSNYESNIELKVKKILESSDFNMVLGYDDQFIFINKNTGRIEHSFKYENRITSNILAINEHIYFGDAGGNIVSYNISSKSIETIKGAHEVEVTNIVLHETANRIISASALGQIKIWMPDLSGPVLELLGHDEGVSFVEVLDGPYFISVSGSGFAFQRMGSDEGNDNTIKKWNIFTAKCEGVYAADELITAICIDNTGKIISGQRNGQVHQFVSSQV